jgi:hypothetical protein
MVLLQLVLGRIKGWDLMLERLTCVLVQVVPTRKVRGARPKAAAGGAAASRGGTAGASAENEPQEFDPDDLLPRTDISGQVRG